MSRIIALQACRHGIGCSHLAANVAVMLMQQGQRVGLIDTDPRSGGLRTLFGLQEVAEPVPHAYWWMSAPSESAHHLTAQLCEHDAPCNLTAPGIYLPLMGGELAATTAYLQALQQRYDHDDARQILTQLCQELQLDYLLIDNQPEMSDNNLVGLSAADVAVVMLQLDTYDFQRTAVILDVIQRLSTARICMVPTLVLPDLEIETVKRKIEGTYQQSVLGILYLAEEMIRLASHGIFCLHYPDHALTQTIADITRQLVTLLNRNVEASQNGSSRSKLGRSRKHPLLHVLEFPALERKLLTLVLRQGPLDLQILLEQSDHTAQETMQAIEHLIAQGWLIHDPQTNRVRYCTAETSHETSS